MRIVLAMLMLAGLGGLAMPTTPTPTPGTDGAASRHATEPDDADDPLSNDACVRCHPLEGAEWLGSPHQTSFSEATFQTAITIEPRAFCRRCHAPEVDPSRPHTADAGALGVACTTCHVHDEAVLAAPLRPAVDASALPAPHAIVRSETFATADACARCHEFPFPDTALRDQPLAMQRTVSEHAASRFADRSCADCHMPRDADGRRSHAFSASRDPQLLRSAVQVTTERIDATTVRVTLRPGEVGHAFPTGDLLRRLEIGAAAVLADGEGPSRRRFLARHFGSRMQRSGVRLRDELHDDRVPPVGERVVELPVPASQGRPIRWWVEYQRVAHQRSFDEADAALDGVVTLAGGTIPAKPEPPR